MKPESICSSFEFAIQAAALKLGATSPNPPVGAAALDADGNILSVQAHQRAGTPHAEALVLRDCRERGIADRIHTMVVTLEPCNHHGRTPPCSEALLAAGVKRVVYGARDPNPKAAGGAERLREAGVEAYEIREIAPILERSSSNHLAGEVKQNDALNLCGEFQALYERCLDLIRPFSHWARTRTPWVTLKTALDRESSMIPQRGTKTFTSPDSLRLAHELRRRCDAILTGSGTILADLPEFTVRHVPDHVDKRRWLAILDRRGRVPANYLDAARARGLEPRCDFKTVQEALEFLGAQGCLEVLVEAGPALSETILKMSLWNEHVLIRQQAPGQPDQVERRIRG